MAYGVHFFLHGALSATPVRHLPPSPPYTRTHSGHSKSPTQSPLLVPPCAAGGGKRPKLPDTFVGAPFFFSQSQKNGPRYSGGGPCDPPPRRPINRPQNTIVVCLQPGPASHRCGLWRCPLPSSPLPLFSSSSCPSGLEGKEVGCRVGQGGVQGDVGLHAQRDAAQGEGDEEG